MPAVATRERVFSGMRPTGQLHVGHLLGALGNWVALQEDYDCIYSVVDLHALTTGYEDPGAIRRNSREMVADWLAVGVDPERSIVFRQSEVHEHAELAMLLGMVTPLSWLERVPTYKGQIAELGEAIDTFGFLGYPLLQTADIILYRATRVPVGQDHSRTSSWPARSCAGSTTSTATSSRSPRPCSPNSRWCSASTTGR